MSDQQISSDKQTKVSNPMPSLQAIESLNSIDIFLQISKFLRVKDLGVLMQISQQMKKNVQEHFRQKLQQMSQLSVAEFEASQTTDYWKIYSEIYNREVLFANISQLPIDKQSAEELKVYRSRKQKQLCDIGIKKFSVGTKFSAFLSTEKILFFCKTTEYFASSDDPSFVFQTRRNIIKFSTTPRNLIFLSNAGEVSIVFFDNNKPSAELSQISLEWTLQVPVKQFKASYGFAAFIIDEDDESRPFNSTYLSKLVSGAKEIVSTQNSPSNNDTQLNVLIYSLNDLNLEDVNNPESNKYLMKRVSECSFSKLNSFAIGYSQLLLVSNENQLYSVDLSNYANIGGISPNTLPAKIFEPLAKRYISKVFSGYANFFAYEREEIQPIKEWTTEQVKAFLGTFEEFQDYLNIVKYESITGADLANINKKFMMDRLGMIRDDLQLKLQTEIIKYRETTFKKERLFGWGKNDQGQLALSKCSNINIPTKIDIPELSKDDVIEVIKVGWKNSLIVTKQRRIFITENRERKEKRVQTDQDQEEEKESSNNNSNMNLSKQASNKSKKRKQSAADESLQEQQNKNKKVSKIVPTQQDQQLKQRWIEITHKFSQLKDKRKYKIIEVSLAKDVVSVLGNCYDNKKLAQLLQGDKLDEKQDKVDCDEEEKKKLTPAISILNRIKWDPALDQSQFTVVYQDRFLKDLEMKFEVFDISDVKSYRVKQIKRLNTIVWDRENKFEDLSL